MEFLDENLSRYAEDHSSAESALLASLNRETHSNVLMPRMLSGHLQGRFLSMISHLIKPKNILEIGTYTGYSALCMAEGLAENGKLHTIDKNEELETMVKKYFSASDFNERIIMHVGNALDIIPTIDAEFDLVFIDADKENYLKYYQMIFDKVRKGGMIMADNVLWSGKIIDEKELSRDKDTKALHEFNQFVQNDKRVENILLPIRDGIMMARKK